MHGCSTKPIILRLQFAEAIQIYGRADLMRMRLPVADAPTPSRILLSGSVDLSADLRLVRASLGYLRILGLSTALPDFLPCILGPAFTGCQRLALF